ncbi:MAG: FecR domain-containing protein [Magnetococcales bacterium]|nr:FecR domain-containing protein [Magnetococcales bacterium]
MKRVVRSILFCGSMGLILPVQASDGMVKTASGDVFIQHLGEKSPAKVGTPLDAKDVLETGADGAVGVTMKDNTRFSLGPNSRFVVEEFAFDPHAQRLALSGHMAAGTLTFNTGEIGKLDPKRIRLTTPLGSIGVRGTSILVHVPEP